MTSAWKVKRIDFGESRWPPAASAAIRGETAALDLVLGLGRRRPTAAPQERSAVPRAAVRHTVDTLEVSYPEKEKKA